MRIILFVDGNNLYHRLKYLTANRKGVSLLTFDFIGFCKWLCKDNELVEIRYYIGAVRRQKNNIKSEKMYADQQRLFFKLQRQNVKIILGQLIRHRDGTYHEKGVDVRLAVEMIRLARQDKYDIAYLLSSDTDLVPAVEEVLSFNKKVKYIGAADSQSFGLSKITGNYLILRPEDIKDFLK
ncbi:NYN domain-containing protein [Patescibacteria group bacterium]|nr:NYN domain-containing protein [Patescibacteria group bacterium]